MYTLEEIKRELEPNEFLFKGENMEILRALLEGKEKKIIEF